MITESYGHRYCDFTLHVLCSLCLVTVTNTLYIHTQQTWNNKQLVVYIHCVGGGR